MNTPLRYSPDVERVAEDEPQVHAELVEQLLKISRITFEDGGKPLRSVHAKSHGVLEGTLTVREGLTEPLAQGLFAKPGSFRAAVRFSTSPGDVLPDSVSTPRGLALKLFDVAGERLPGADDQGTQDFLFVTGKAFSAPDAASFVKTLKLLAATTDRVPDLKVALSRVLRGAEATLEAVGGESAALKGLGGYPPTHILSESFFSQVPMRHGDYIAKMGVFPVAPQLLALSDHKLDVDGDSEAIRHAVIEHFATRGGAWDLCAQLCIDLEKMPVEDASVAWDEKLSPFVPVARLEIPLQDAWSARLQEEIDNRMAFNPWHCLAAHRPLGSVMRARRAAYAASSDFRLSKAGCPVAH